MGMPWARWPPSTGRTTPETQDPAGDEKNSAAPAMSAAAPTRPNGTCFAMPSSVMPQASNPLVMRLGTKPGAMALTVTLGARSLANFFVSEWRAALDVS